MTTGCPPIGDRPMADAEHQRRCRERHRQTRPAAPSPAAIVAPTPRRLVVDGRDRILVALPPKGERIYFDEDGREIDEPPPHPGRTYIDHRGRIVEEVTGTTEEELARMYGITVEEWRPRHPER